MLNVVKQRWFVSLLGVLMIAALIWFVGPLIAIAGTLPLNGVVARLVLIVVIVLVWGGNLLREKLTAAKASKALAQGMSKAEGDPSDGRRAKEAEVLNKRFQEAMEVLKRYRSPDGKKHSLLELPWYVIIGPPGAGKTTALVNSGLSFPLAEKFGKEALHGVGGTRNCDWWFTDQAVLLDTAGRYVTQDSDKSVDSAGWRTFLEQLKRYRKRRPINGVLVAISVLDLMTLNSEERAQHTHAIRTRIAELNEYLNIRFPVYVLLTKCDLLAGFMEFFDDLGREERAQVWGVTFPYSEDPSEAVAEFGTEFDALIERLNGRLFWRLNNERDARRRVLIHGFTPQVASLRETINEFIAGVFGPSRFEEPVLLRGVYFTSGTQEGAPIDRVMGAVARAFGVRAAPQGVFSGQGRSYFLTRLLREVIFGEAGLAGTSQRAEHRRRWSQRAALVSALVLTVGLGIAWSTSFTGNTGLVEDTRERLDAYDELAARDREQAGGYLEGLVQRLDGVAAIPAIFQEYRDEGVPLRLGFGLYQGRKLGNAGVTAYQRLLSEEFIPTVAQRVGVLLGQTGDDLDLTYEIFKLYLMFGEPERLDPDLLRLISRLDWERNWPQDAVFRGRLEHHLDEAIRAGINAIELDAQLVEFTRATLNRLTPAELIYGRLRRDYAAAGKKDFDPGVAMGPFADRIFLRKSGRPLGAKIPALYTKAGFFEGFLVQSRSLSAKLKAEAWVLGDEQTDLSRAEQEQINDQLDKLYTRDFIKHWQDLLDDLDVKPFAGVAQASERIDLLAGNQSPLRALLGALASNSNLLELPGGTAAASAGKLSEKAYGGTLDRLKRLLSQSDGSDTLLERNLPGRDVVEHFKPLVGLVERADGAPAPYDEIGVILSELSAALNVLSSGESDGKSSSAVAQRLRVIAARQPEPVRSWLLAVATTSYGEVRKDTVSTVRKEVSGAIAEASTMCRRAIAGRYPLDAKSRQSATLADFSRFFGPGGQMDTFFRQNIAEYVDKSRSPWRWKAVDGITVSSSVQTLRQFEVAERVRETFFANGGLGMSFSLKPVSLDSQLKEVQLDIGGQKISYRHGPVRSYPASWPSPEGGLTVRVLFIDINDQQLNFSDDGPWAWLRILDRANMRRLSDDRYAVVFQQGGYRAEFELRANSVINPFMVSGLDEFTCPENL